MKDWVTKILGLKKPSKNPKDRDYEKVAASWGLLNEYWLSRRHGATPEEALMEWDIWDYERNQPFYRS